LIVIKRAEVPELAEIRFNLTHYLDSGAFSSRRDWVNFTLEYQF